jgi:hypothetical protein
MTQENEIYGTLGFWFFKNMDLDKGTTIDLGAGRVLIKDQLDVNEPEPDIRFITAERNFDLLSEHSKNFILQKSKLKGMPSAILQDTKEMSGRAIELDRIELNEKRRLDKQKLQRFDNELVRMICIVRSADGFPINTPDKFKIIYSDNLEIVDKTEMLDYYIKLMDLGIYSIIDVMKAMGFENNENKLKQILKTNKGINDEYRSGNKQPIQEGFGIAENGNRKGVQANDNDKIGNDRNTTDRNI